MPPPRGLLVRQEALHRLGIPAAAHPPQTREVHRESLEIANVRLDRLPHLRIMDARPGSRTGRLADRTHASHLGDDPGARIVQGDFACRGRPPPPVLATLGRPTGYGEEVS